MLQSFPTKAKSAQKSGKTLVEYQFYGLDTTENWNSQQSRGSGGQWTKNSKLYCHAGTVTRCPAQLLDAGWLFFCEFGVWRTEGHMELERSTNGCQGLRWSASDPVFLYWSVTVEAMQWPDWDPAKFSFAQLWGSSLHLCVSVHHQANLRWHAQKLCCNRCKA